VVRTTALMTNLLTKLALMTLLLLTLASPLHAEHESQTGGDVVIKADSMSQNSGQESVTAEGNVIISYSGLTLKADSATYNRTTGLLIARGNLVLTKGDDTLKGETATLDIQTGRGIIDNGKMFIPQSNASITSSQIVRLDDIRLEMKQNELTCSAMQQDGTCFFMSRMYRSSISPGSPFRLCAIKRAACSPPVSDTQNHVESSSISRFTL
jgi:lipopolysaccharide assembly outer membrane protein LptD (OstA)